MSVTTPEALGITADQLREGKRVLIRSIIDSFEAAKNPDEVKAWRAELARQPSEPLAPDQ